MKKISLLVIVFFLFLVNLQATPTTPANNLTFTTINQTSLSFTWTRGNGDRCLVTVRPSTSGVSHPTNQLSEYATSTTYGNGDYLGTNTYCVYKGTGTSTTVYGLSQYTQYTISIYEYDIPSGFQFYYQYLTSPYETGAHYTLTTQPVTQASALTASAISPTGATLSWTSGSGAYDIASVKQSSTNNTNNPVDGFVYSSSATYGSGSTWGSSPYSYVTYNGSGTSFTVNGCAAATDYVANCFTYDGLNGGQNYLLSSPPQEGFTTLAAQPSGNCTYFLATDITDNAMTLNWVRPVSGAGANVLVTMRTSTTAELPVDQNNYTASSVFGSGSLIGSSYVVYAGNSNTVRVTGLLTNTRYYVAIVEYNGGPGTFNPSNNYATSYLTGSQYTLPAEPTASASNLVFSNVQTNQVTASWTNGNGAERVVAVRPSRIQTALAFDGTNDYVGIPFNSVLQPTTAVTLECWAYKSNWGGTQYGTLAGNTEAGGYSIQFYGSGAWLYGYVRRNGVYAIPGVDVSYLLPGWHHFALTFDGRYARIYVDGAEKDMDDAGATYPLQYTYSNSLIIGAEAGSGSAPSSGYFNGYIDEVRLWNTAAPTTTIRNNMNKSMTGNESGLVGAWSLNDGFTTTTTAGNASLNSTVIQGTLYNFGSTGAATSFTGTSGWIKSGAVVDLPLDFNYYSYSTVYNYGSQVGNKYFTVVSGNTNSVTVTGLSPDTYYDFIIAEEAYTGYYRNYLVSTHLSGDVLTASQPVPTITSFSPASGNIGTIVTINGTNFSTTTTNNTVYFGATKATVLTATAAQLTVLVPYCANYVTISVSVNTAKGVSRTPFVVTSSCSASLSAGSFTANTTTVTGATHSGVFAKDIDKDGKSDLLLADVANVRFSVLRNQSANGTLSWGSQYNFSTNSSPQYLIADDIDGDEKPDVVVGCNASPATLDIYRNTSSPGSVSFGPKVQLATATSPTLMALTDFDRDGRLDLVAGHSTAGVLQVYRNTSSMGFISFALPISIPGLSDAYAVRTADINGDGLIDLVVGDRSANMLSFFQNTSTIGNISFGSIVNVNPSTGVQGVGVGDLNNDGKPDVCAALYNNTIRVYQNTNTGGAISSANFSLQATLNTYTVSSASPYGVEINDLDGDGGNDIVCGYSLGGGTVSVFEKTTPTGFSFSTRLDYTTSGLISYFLAVDDFSLDGRTDFVTSYYGTTYSVYNSNVNALTAEPVGTSSVTINSITQTSFNVVFTGGGGSEHLVVVKPSSSPQVLPTDGVGYSFNSDYSIATDIGAGNKIVYRGGSTSTAVTNLSSNTTYNVYVYELSGSACSSNYLTSSYGSNSATTLNYQPTLNTITSPPAICQNSGIQSVSLSGIGTGGETQTLSVSASSSNTTLIPNGNISVNYVSPAAVGTVSFTPVNGQYGSSVITVTVNDGASNNNTISKTFTVTVTQSPTTANAGTNATICASLTTLGGNQPSVGNGTWSFIYPPSPTITITNPTQYNSQINNFSVGDSVRLAWTISNPPCAPSVSYVSIKRILCPLDAEFVAAQTDYCGTSASVNFTDLSTVPGPNSIVYWAWSFPGGSPATYTTSVGGNPPAISYTAAGTYDVSLYVVDNNLPTANNNTETKYGYISITAYPGAATTINGGNTVCQGQNVTYSIAPISGANTYSWTLPPGASIAGPANTATVQVSYSPAASSGTISVTGQNTCGNGTTYNQAITVNPLPATAGPITGPSSACQGATGVVFSTSSIAGATGYNWYLPSGATITGGTNTNTITVSFSSSATDGTIDVKGVNGCGEGTSSSGYAFSIDSLPLPAGAISGATTVCPGDTVIYGISSLPYASTYSWTLPAGASVIAGASTETVTVAYSIAAASGTIAVSGINSCGAGTSSALAVTVDPLPGPASAILFNSGNTTVCAGSPGTISCFVSAIPNANSYSWNLPAGYSINSGQGTNNILISIAPTAVSGTISVNGTNNCGDGASSGVAVTISPLPDSANSISGSATVCQSQTGVIYTIPAIANATGYSWNLPLGGSITAGANTNSITVSYSSTADTGFVTVTGTNGCGSGLSTDSFAVTVNPLPDPAGAITGNNTIIICPAQTGVVYTTPAVNNATGYTWSVPTGAVIASGANTTTIVVNYSDTAVTGNITVTPVNACGNGTSAVLVVNVDTVPSQSICMVTVDTLSSKNFLIWEKPVSTRIDSFFIYREIASVFTKVGAVAYTGVSEFVDVVNPNVTSYRYKLSSVDSCGNESPLSAFHRTIHLQVSVASPCGFNLQWNDYAGFPVTQYRILRDSIGNGIYLPFDSVSFGTTTWTDTICYTANDSISYRIEIDHPSGCTSSAINSGTEATNLNSSRSNVYRIGGSGTTGTDGEETGFSVSVYPNPGKGLFTIRLDSYITDGTVHVYNTLGEEVRKVNVKPSEKTISLNLLDLAEGIYQVQVKTPRTVVNKNIIIQ